MKPTLSVTDERKRIKVYIDKKIELIKKKYKSNGELIERLDEMVKCVQMGGSVSVNLDTLTVTKKDSKILGIIFQYIHIIETIELYPEKINPELIEKYY